MMTGDGQTQRVLRSAPVSELLGPELLCFLADIQGRMKGELYLTGGTVRDLVMGRNPGDIDLTVPDDARGWAARLASMSGGTFVTLGRDEDAARVVWRGRDIDFSSYREGALTIDKELANRDITVNSMAVSVRELLPVDDAPIDDNLALEIIDPLDGLEDIGRRQIRVSSDSSFTSDPLRLLRVFRFAATLDFSIDKKTFECIARQKELIARSAPERVCHELDLVMATDRSYPTCKELAEAGLLFEIIPELRFGVGMEQPSSHHLDVFDHCLAALKYMERILDDPAVYFPNQQEVMTRFLAVRQRRSQLKWAALFHDLGKPPTMAINEDRGGRITFYNHDREGMRLVRQIAKRLRWSRENAYVVESLVGLHMRPFFLGNDMRQGRLTLKGCLRLIKSAEGLLPGLFLLSMADALAGKGENRPEKIEMEVAQLFERLEKVRTENVEPVRSSRPLITGRDLIDELNLAPGPLFKKILDLVEDARMENRVVSRGQALALARDFLNTGNDGNGPDSE